MEAMKQIRVALSLSCCAILLSAVEATVPAGNTFSYVNAGDFGDHIVEYDASYRSLPLFESPFQLCFYNTTPNEFTLALRMGLVESESLMVWVWEANRGNPVRENAVFSLRQDGNLILADSDGRIAWQSNTADRGVLGFKILKNGNMVLYGANGKFIWQSFDTPSDTLLVDQYLRLSGPNTLISRFSSDNNTNGLYSMVLETSRLAMYYSSPLENTPLLYFSSAKFLTVSGSPLNQVSLRASTKGQSGASNDVSLEFLSGTGTVQKVVLSRPRRNPLLSYMRLGIDGNVKIYVYDDSADTGAWETIFTLFDGRAESDGECQLPTKCGDFGICSGGQCVTCVTGTPFVNSSRPWNPSCSPPLLNSCFWKDFVYSKFVGVDHFVSRYTDGMGPMSQEACSEKCTHNCKCEGYFYHQATSKCWPVNDLKTLITVNDDTHLGFIKIPIYVG